MDRHGDRHGNRRRAGSPEGAAACQGESRRRELGNVFGIGTNGAGGFQAAHSGNSPAGAGGPDPDGAIRPRPPLLHHRAHPPAFRQRRRARAHQRNNGPRGRRGADMRILQKGAALVARQQRQARGRPRSRPRAFSTNRQSRFPIPIPAAVPAREPRYAGRYPAVAFGPVSPPSRRPTRAAVAVHLGRQPRLAPGRCRHPLYRGV